jgi:hypothetical protein
MEETPTPSPPALAGRLSRRQALLASGLTVLAYSSLRGTASAAVGDQDSWRFCQKCFSLFYDGGANKGRCPADGGPHISQGFVFTPHYDDSAPGRPDVQYNWRFCSKCFGMFYNGSTRGRCPSGGSHVAQGFNFGLNRAAAVPPSSQTQWRFCQQCFALFYNGGSSKGRCPVGGAHVAQGFNFNLPYHLEAAVDPSTLPEFLAFDQNSITFKGGVAANGNSHVKLHRDGRVEFTTHFNDSGALDYYYSIAWAIFASDGMIFTLRHVGKVNGHFTGGQADRKDDFNGDTTSPLVASHWPALAKTRLARMSAHAASKFSLLHDTVKEAADAVVDAATAFDSVYQGVAKDTNGIFDNLIPDPKK